MEKMPAVHCAAHPHLREELQRLLARLVARPSVSVRVACDAGDEDTLVGCVITEGATLLFVYVLADFRRLGLARMLCEGVDSYGFSTPALSRRMKPGVRQWRYLPRLSWEIPEGM